MNVLKIYNKYCLYKKAKLYVSIFIIFFSATVLAEAPVTDLAKPIDTSNILVVTLGLMFVLGLFFLLVFLLKKIPAIQRHHSGILKIIDTLYIGTNEKVILVDVGEKQIVIGVNNQTINTLYVMEETIKLDGKFQQEKTNQNFSKMISDKLLSIKN